LDVRQLPLACRGEVFAYAKCMRGWGREGRSERECEWEYLNGLAAEASCILPQTRHLRRSTPKIKRFFSFSTTFD